MASTTTVTASRPASVHSKPEFVTDFSEFDNNDEDSTKDNKLVKTLDSVRLGLTTLAVLSAITVLGTAGDALANYNSTKLGSDYILSIWPNEFDIRPTHAIVICSVIVLVSSLISLVGIKVAAVSAILNHLIQGHALTFFRFATTLFSTSHLLSSSLPSASSLRSLAHHSSTASTARPTTSLFRAGHANGPPSRWTRNHTGRHCARRARSHYTSP